MTATTVTQPANKMCRRIGCFRFFELHMEVVTMSKHGHQSIVRILAVVLLAPFTGEMVCHAQDAGAAPWGEFLKRFEKDRLLKKPFHMMPETEVKGLASKIRARELDIPNRRKAIRYLKDLDCTQFPEAKEMLLSLLNPEEEKWEEVRFEAARALRDMLARHSCNPESGKSGKNGKSNCDSGNCNNDTCDASLWEQCTNSLENTGKRVRGERTKPQTPPCHCTSCCDAKTLNTLAKTAYEMKEDGCCYEPSLRVRQMAVEAIKVCGVPCNFKPYYGEFDEESGPPAVGEGEIKTESESDREGVNPPMNEGEPEPAPAGGSTAIPGRVPSIAIASTPISRLENLCIVSYAKGEMLRPDLAISATHRGRVYYFANEEAREEFTSDPDQYAVAFGGCDPVHFLATREPVEGRFLVNHEGRFYMFSTKENVEAFKSNPSRYMSKPTDTGRIASSR